MHDRVIFIDDLIFNEPENFQTSRIIFSNNKIYVILFRELEYDELKWLNFYIFIYSKFNYGKNFDFSFCLTKENYFFHQKVFSEHEIRNFKSDTLIKLTEELKKKKHQ